MPHFRNYDHHFLCLVYSHMEACHVIIVNVYASNLICWLFYIFNPPKLVVLIPHHSPYTPSINCVNTFVDHANTSNDYINTSIDYVNTSINSVNTSIDYVNTYNDYSDIYTNYADKSINCDHTCADYAITFVDSANTPLA